jgi:hypothetical protein
MPPRVPLSPQVQEQIHPGVRLDASVPEGAFGGGRPLAHNVALANQNIDIIKEEQQKIDFYDALDGITQLKKWENESGYESVLGENARELPKRMQEEYSKRTADIAGTLKNDRQRAIFQQKADQNGVGFMGGVINHTRRQKSISEAQKTDAFVSTFQDAGIKAGASGNFADMEKSTGEIDGVRRIWGSQNGIPDIEIERMIREDSGRVYSGAIGSMLDSGNDIAAKEAFTKYGQMISDSRERGRLERMVNRQSTLGEAQRISDGVFAPKLEGYKISEGVDGVREVPGAETLKDAMERGRAATEGKSPELRKAVDEQITYEWGLKQRADAEANKKIMVDAANMIDGGTRYEKLPASLIESLKPTDRNSLKAYADKEPVTDDATWYTLKLMGSSEVTRDAFTKLNLLDERYLNKLSKPDRKKFMEWQGDLIEKKEKAIEEGRGFLTANAIVSAADDKIPRAHRGSFSRIANDQAMMWQSKNPDKKFGSKEATEIVDMLLAPVKKERSYWWDGTQMMYETIMNAPLGEVQTKRRDKLADMSEAHRDQIQKDFKALGIPITENNVFDAYEALLNREEKARNAGK